MLVSLTKSVSLAMQSLVLHMYSHTVETALKCIKSQYIKIIPSKSLFGHYKAVL